MNSPTRSSEHLMFRVIFLSQNITAKIFSFSYIIIEQSLIYSKERMIWNIHELKKQLLTEEELDKVAGGSDSSFQKMPPITGENKPEDSIAAPGVGKIRKR